MIISDNNYRRKLIFLLFDLNISNFRQGSSGRNRRKNEECKDKEQGLR